MNEITPEEFKKNRNRFFLLDVRTKKENAESRIKGTTLIPLPELEDRLDELPKQDIVVYCRSDNRSSYAVSILEKHGFRAFNLVGGIESWKDKGFGVEPKTS